MASLYQLLCILLLSSTSLIESAPTEPSGSCLSCEKLVQFSRKLSDSLKNHEVRKNVAKWCVDSNLGDNLAMCDFVLNNTESVLSKVDSNRFCFGIEACHSHHLPPLIETDAGNSPIECEFCLNTLTHIKEIVSSPATANEIKSVLSTGCESLKELKDECLKLIDEELDSIFKFIRESFDPKQLCIETHSCPSRKFNIPSIDNKLPELTDFVNIVPPSLSTPVVLQKGPVAVSTTPQCLVCHLIFKIIGKELEKNSTVEEIEKLLDDVCSKIFKDESKATECQERVDKYAKQIIDLASSGASAEVACLIIGACDVGETSGKIIKNPVAKPKASLECELCKKLFEYLYNFLGGDRAQEAIEKALDKVCDKVFSGAQSSTCEKYVNTYTPVITEIIIKTTNPDEACSLFKLCDASIESAETNTPLITFVSKSIPKTGSSSICDVCKADLKANLVQIQSVRSYYGPRLDSTCRSLQQSKDFCSSYQKTINATFDILEKNSDPITACTFFGACSSGIRTGKSVFTGERENSITANSDQNSVNQNVEGVKGVICSECKAITRYIEEQVSDYKTEEEIAEFIKNDVCGRLPNPELKEACKSIMAEYGDTFIYKIALKIFDPEMVCSKEFRVCPSLSSMDDKSEIEIVNDAVGSTCNLCVDMVSKMESLEPSSNLTSNGLVSQICTQFNSQESIEKCKIMYDAFGAHFAQMINFDSPQKICSSVDICYNNENVHLLGGQKCTFGPAYWCHTSDHANACKAMNYCKKKVWKAIEEKDVKDTPQCVLCHLLLNIVDKELEKNSTVEEIESILDNACSKIYKDHVKLTECKDRVEKYTKSFIDLATQGVAPEVACIIFGFCQAGEDTQGVACLRNEKISCPLCKEVVEKVYASLSENKTREEIDQALENACNLMPETQKQACLVYVKVYDEKLAQLIAEAADADEVCRKIGLCSEQADEIVESKTAPDPECILCKRVFEYIYSYLQENRTQGAIEEALDKVCDDIFPVSRKKSCRKFVDTYTSQIIDIVLQTTDPNEACVLLGMCKQSTKYSAEIDEVEEIVEIVPLTRLGPKAKPLGNSADDCVKCYKNTAAISTIFDDEISSLSAVITNACAEYLKDDAKCKNYMATYFDQALSALDKETNVEYICQNVLQICPPDTVERENSIEREMTDRNEIEVEGRPRVICAECELFAKFIQSRIYNYKTEEEITNFIKNDVCSNFITEGLRDSCRSFINEYGDSIIQMIALKVFDPQTICSKELRLCSSNEFDFIDKKVEETCKLCIEMVSKMESQSNPDSKSICSQYQSDEKNQKCQSIYGAFGGHFSSMIAFDSAEKICEVVDLCYSISNHHLLGGQKCSFGPTYWCNTKAHADACNASDYCRKKVWMPIE